MGLQVAEIRPISRSVQTLYFRVWEAFANWENAFKRSKKFKKRIFLFRRQATSEFEIQTGHFTMTCITRAPV